jgi:CubicO group peptidase (beta-lactamase class C family)
MMIIKLKCLVIQLLLLISFTGITKTACAQTDKVDSFIRGVMQKNRIPGMQLAVIRHGKIIKLSNYGLISVEYNIPVTSKSLFPVNSITKAFTGVALMELVEEGKLDLTAPVSRYLDSLPAAWQTITIQQLATHVSGIPDIVDGNFNLVGNGGEDNAWAKVKSLPIDFTPGEKFSYNQNNYTLLGKVIQKLSGKPFTRFIKEREFDVAGMEQTSYHDSKDVVANIARTYTYLRFTANDVIVTDTLRTRYEEFPGIIRTAAGIHSTAEELANWIIAIQQHKLLKKDASLATMWTPARLKNGSTAGFSDLLNGYAIGWPIVTRPKHRAIATVGGERAAVFIYPDDDLAIVILTNLMGASPQSFIDDVAEFYFLSPGTANK